MASTTTAKRFHHDLRSLADGYGVLCLIADYYGCRGIMGELFEDDLTRNKEKTFAFFGKRGFEVLCQEDNKVHPYRVQTTTYRDRLPEGIVLSLTGLES